MQKRNSLTGVFLTLPSLLGIFAFYVFPFVSSLFYTFTQGVSEPKFVGFANFRDVFGNTIFRQAVGNTAVFLITALPLTLLLYLLRNVGYLSIILMSAIRALPGEYQESYRLDGGGEGGYIFHILIPLLSPPLLFAGIVAVMNYFLLFRDIYMLYGDTPPRQLYMLQHFMNNNFYKLNYQRLSAAAFLTVLCLSAFVVVVLLLQRSVKSHVE